MPASVITVEQMRQWEAATWAAGASQSDVIRAAAAAVAAVARRLTRPNDRILILAGKGNNGEDARLAQEFLGDRHVTLLNINDPTVSFRELPDLLGEKPALVIDGLFGIGLNRALDENWTNLIEWINFAKLPVLAVDVPSGLNADTGVPQGAAVRATVTLTLGAPKRGLLEERAWPYVGRLEVAPEIGLVPCPFKTDLRWTLPGDFAGFPPPRPAYAHKGNFGHLLIVAGSMGFHGAAVLAARAAQRAMPGLITVFTPENIYPIVAMQMQGVMVNTWQSDTRLPEYGDGLLFGPGMPGRDLPPNVRYRMRRAWHNAPFPVLVDASGLDWLTAEPKRLEAKRVITPHPGEAARMLNVTADEVQRNRVGALRELSRKWGDCIVVLKGHQTLVGTSAGEIFVNSTGNPGLAQGGTGDVLAGFLAGLMVQPAMQEDFLHTMRYGVWQHGLAADYLAGLQRSWTVENLVHALGTISTPY